MSRCWVAVAALLLAGCSGPATDPERAQPERVQPEQAQPEQEQPTSGPTGQQTAQPSVPRPDPAPRLKPSDVRTATAVHTVRHLAGTIGPRMATGPAYDKAATWVQRRLTEFGFHVVRQPFRVPAGDSWGVPVEAGTSRNLVAAAPGLDRTEPHLVVGAHLDTVQQAPGAEDNASGVGVLLAVAEAAAERRTRLPVVFVVFGAEEPRGPTDDDHHYGSRHHVAQLTTAERRALRGMIALDRVGVGDVVPVCSAQEPGPLRAELLAAGRQARVPTRACEQNRASDHWSFVRDGLPGARLGSTPYAGYHSAADVPAVVQPAQLARTARLTAAWLSASPRSSQP